jgi:hypothetical protein
MPSSAIIRVWLVHVGFHTLWVLLFVISLLGVFALIPLVGWYNAFVLGFLGKGVLASATRAALLGYLVFSVSGLLSGWLISLLRPKSVWIFAFLSLVLTGVLLVSVTMVRYKTVGVPGLQTILPLPTTTGRADVDELSMALKTEYDLVEPPVPLHIAEKGTVIPFSELQPSLQLLPKGFQLSGGPYVYCNLPSQVWKGLKKDGAGRKYPLLWSTQPDATGKRLVVSVDLKTDQFSDELLADETLAQMLADLELAVRKQTGDANFTLPK